MNRSLVERPLPSLSPAVDSHPGFAEKCRRGMQAISLPDYLMSFASKRFAKTRNAPIAWNAIRKTPRPL